MRKVHDHLQISCPAALPAHTSASPPMTCTTMFTRARGAWPFRKRLMVSLLNVEKVVYPPSIPMKTRVRAAEEKFLETLQAGRARR